jgi:molybdopterin synthase sulfur carrier subunit
MAKVSIPLLLQDVTGGARQAEVPGSTLAEVVAALEAMHPGIGTQLHDGEKISPHLAFVVDGKIATRGLDTPVGPGAQVSILPAFGGG